jgi:hypothetical protein
MHSAPSAGTISVTFSADLHDRTGSSSQAPGNTGQPNPTAPFRTMALSKASSLRAREIEEPDLSGVSDLLAEGFPERPRRFWSDMLARLTQRPSGSGLPRYGYLLDSDGAVVGALITIFSSIETGVDCKTRCNVSSWFVKPAFRPFASLLVSKALSRKNVTYVNITPAPHTLPIVQAQGYLRYNDGIFIAVPALQMSGPNVRVVAAESGRAPRDVDPFEQQLLSEHATFGCTSLWCTAGDGSFPLVFRRRRLKGMPGCAQLVYCRDIEDFGRFAGPIGRFLAVRGSPLVLMDCSGPIPGLLGRYFPARMPKYFRGPDRPRFGDLAYTETAMFGV